MITFNPVQNFYSLIKNKSTLPRWVIFVLDLSFCAIALFYAFLLRFNIDFQAVLTHGLIYPLSLLTSVNIISFRMLRTSKGIIRLSGAQEGLRVITATFLTTLILSAGNAVCSAYGLPFFIPTSVLIIYFFTASFILFAYRMTIKQLYNKSLRIMLNQKNVLIFGKIENGLMLKNAIESFGSRQYKVVGFISDENYLWGKSVDEARIFGLCQIKNTVSKYNIEEIFLSSDEVNIEVKNKVAEFCLENNIRAKVIPAINKWVNGQLPVNQLKNLKIEDLLNRPSIQIAPDHIQKYLAGKTILITGAAGSIGSEIVKQLAAFDTKMLILCDNRETGLYELQYELNQITTKENIVLSVSDVRSYGLMRHLFETYNPDIVFHAAAYKHVPLMEMHPCQAIKNNISGTKNVADLSVAFGVERFVFVSTDKAVNPTNVMGATKRIAEMYVAELQLKQLKNYHNFGMDENNTNEILRNSGNGITKFITTRFGNVLGSNGSVIPRFYQQIEKGGPVTVTHPDITRYFMTIPEACSLVLEAGTMGHGGEIFVFDMGEPVKITDLAFKMIKLAGMTPGKDIKIEFSGLRPGEKLYEELLNNSEEVMPTHHKKIMISKVSAARSETFNMDIEKLIQLGDRNKHILAVKLMKHIVKEYKSENSVYAELDVIVEDNIDLESQTLSYDLAEIDIKNKLNPVFQ